MYGIASSESPLNSSLDMMDLTPQQVIVLCSLHNLHHAFYKFLCSIFVDLLSVRGLEAFQKQLDLYAQLYSTPSLKRISLLKIPSWFTFILLGWIPPITAPNFCTRCQPLTAKSGVGLCRGFLLPQFRYVPILITLKLTCCGPTFIFVTEVPFDWTANIHASRFNLAFFQSGVTPRRGH